MALKIVRLRYAGECAVCGRPKGVGSRALWDKSSRSVYCVACAGSARRLAELEVDAAGAATTAPPISILDLPAQRIDVIPSEPAFVLHDRMIPGSDTSVDHVAVGPRGVFVIAAKHYKRRAEKRNNGGWLFPDWRLYVGGRDRSSLLDDLSKQVAGVDAVAADLVAAAGGSITPVLCLAEAEWSPFSTGFEIAGVQIVGPKKMAEMVREPGPLTADQMLALATGLADRLPPAEAPRSTEKPDGRIRPAGVS